VPTGFPFIDLNSEIFVVIRVKLSMAIIPIIKQITLDKKARANHRRDEIKKFDGIAIAPTQIHAISSNDISLFATSYPRLKFNIKFLLVLRETLSIAISTFMAISTRIVFAKKV
jgi:hypothetical protein